MKFPKNDKYFSWTSHIKGKMMFYSISEQKIKTILKSPDRREEGIAPDTMAVMKRNDTPKRKEELWVLYASSGKPTSMAARLLGEKKVMISTWRYPGKSKLGKPIPIPDEILQEIRKEWFGEGSGK